MTKITINDGYGYIDGCGDEDGSGRGSGRGFGHDYSHDLCLEFFDLISGDGSGDTPCCNDGAGCGYCYGYCSGFIEGYGYGRGLDLAPFYGCGSNPKIAKLINETIDSSGINDGSSIDDSFINHFLSGIGFGHGDGFFDGYCCGNKYVNNYGFGIRYCYDDNHCIGRGSGYDYGTFCSDNYGCGYEDGVGCGIGYMNKVNTICNADDGGAFAKRNYSE